jgi:hypothetical protein
VGYGLEGVGWVGVQRGMGMGKLKEGRGGVINFVGDSSGVRVNHGDWQG